MSVNSVTDGLVGTGKSSGATSKLAADYQSFLTLLVAQVQNQDPLAPMESTEFVSQLAQLTQVEQSVQVNSQMESLRTQLALNAALAETNMIGRQVTSPSETFNVDETGGRFWYQLETDATVVQAQIRDENGTLIAVIDGLSPDSGKMIPVEWSGETASGLNAQPGRYKISIAATDADGKTGSYNTYSDAKVIAVDYTAGQTWLQLADGQRVRSGEIVRAE